MTKYTIFNRTDVSSAMALAAGILLLPQSAQAETCALVQSGNAFSINASDNTFNPATNCTGASTASNIACGDGSSANGTNSTAVGANSTANTNATAVGQGASATGANSVALGQGSTDGGAANVVSVGATGNERRISNVAAGTAGTDAVNLTQLNAVNATATTAASNASTALSTATTALSSVSTASTSAATALTNSATALSTANTAQTTANSALSAVTAQATTISAIQALDAQQSTQIASLQAGQTALGNLVTSNNQAANAGIAAAMALGGTVMPQDAKFALSFNLATYRGQQGFSASGVVRANDHVYLQAGVAGSTVKGSTGGRVGMTLAR